MATIAAASQHHVLADFRIVVCFPPDCPNHYYLLEPWTHALATTATADLFLACNYWDHLARLC